MNQNDLKVLGTIESVTIKENGVRVNLVVTPDGRNLQVLSMLCGQFVTLEAVQSNLDLPPGE